MWSALHCAAQKGQVDAARLLIEANACVHMLNNEKRTPLHWAAINGHSDVALLLIQQNAAVNAADQEVFIVCARSVLVHNTCLVLRNAHNCMICRAKPLCTLQ
jgi:ankyrin repeat protein